MLTYAISFSQHSSPNVYSNIQHFHNFLPFQFPRWLNWILSTYSKLKGSALTPFIYHTCVYLCLTFFCAWCKSQSHIPHYPTATLIPPKCTGEYSELICGVNTP